MNIFKPFRFLSKLEIANEATQILQNMERSPNYKPSFPLDASRVAEFLGLDVVWDSIPADGEGVIAARILPWEYLIEINEDIPKLRGGFGESTIAHEIGHWVLHIDQQEVQQLVNLQRQGKNVSLEPLLCRSASVNRGIEWQAQYFAACLLMPEHILREIQGGRDLTSWRDLYGMAEELGVTISNLVTRLKDLDWIYFQENFKQIYLGMAAPVEYEVVVV